MRTLLRASKALIAGYMLLGILGCDRATRPESSPRIVALAPSKTKSSEPAPPPTSLLNAPATQETQATQAAVENARPPKVNASDEFFDQGVIPELRIRLTAKEERQLRADQRRYVDCTLIENGPTTYKKVKVKLKGAAGSFRNLDDRPAFTLTLKKKGERFHGMDKFHLNNSVQDETYLNELVASRICLEAGCPAPRVSHARVWLNDRDLGFYVLKEGFDELFLKRHFADPRGNLYDGAFCNDIDAALEKDCGDGPDDLSDIKALIAACREGDQAKRWATVAERLDIDAFLNFVALELMMGHWDGYAQNRNNYRVYFRADDKQAMFLPHGMDQMFKDVNYPVFHVPSPMVTSAVLQNPAWSAKYRERIRELLPLFAPEKLQAKVDAGHARIRPVVAGMSEDRAQPRRARARIPRSRHRPSKRHSQPVPAGTDSLYVRRLGTGRRLGGRRDGDAKLEKKDVDGKSCLSLSTGQSNRCVSSYRAKVRLAKGSYRFEAQVKPTGVVGLGDDKGAGRAGVRLSGGVRQNQALDTTDWQMVSHSFEVAEELREVELVVELRSTAGSALFDAASLRVVKAN